MDIKINIVSRIILVGLLLVVAGSLLSHVMKTLFSGHKKNKHNPDFDALIRQKENMMRFPIYF